MACVRFGLIAAVGYARGLIYVLTELWPDAEVGKFLTLHVGAGSLIAGFVGTVLMYYLIDGSSDLLKAYLPGWNVSYLGIVGVALILLVLFFPKGLLGTVRDRFARWLP